MGENCASPVTRKSNRAPTICQNDSPQRWTFVYGANLTRWKTSGYRKLPADNLHTGKSAYRQTTNSRLEGNSSSTPAAWAVVPAPCKNIQEERRCQVNRYRGLQRMPGAEERQRSPTTAPCYSPSVVTCHLNRELAVLMVLPSTSTLKRQAYF
jgi:hypothetical protein